MAWVEMRRKLGGAAVKTFFETLASASRWHPSARRATRELFVEEDVAYGPDPMHRLDVWRRRGQPPGPSLLFVHGGGFRILSKNTHWMMAMGFARAGYTVFTIDYRLAPKDPFPAALEDTCRAFEWLLDHAPEYGGDPDRIALAGESAGANLITALTVACCFPRPEPYAASIFERARVPDAILPACGLLQVSAPERFAARSMNTLFRDRIHEVCRGYLGPFGTRPGPEAALADPLLVLEAEGEPARALPPAYLCVGSADPIEEDTLRLDAALRRRGVPCQLDVYEGEMHAFHALVWRDAARACWAAQLDFLSRTVPTPTSVANSSQSDAKVFLGS